MNMEKGKADSKKLIEKIPKDITPKDDAFHGSADRRAAEWWYFDVILDNGYTAHIGCMTFSKNNKGNAQKVLEIYKDGKPIFAKREKYKFKEFQTSKEVPSVKFNDESLIEFDQDRFEKTGEWAYKISIKIEDYGFNLIFLSTTKGWKIQTDRESWTVAQPKAVVSGELSIKGKKMSVKGIGYHDHNWNYTLLTLLNYGKGWYWGRIMSKSYNITFAKIIKSKNLYELHVVVNVDNKGYYVIKPDRVKFKTNKIVKHLGKKTPTEFYMKIKDGIGKTPIKIDIEMKNPKIHFEKRLLFLSYWRFHVKSKGFISVDSKKENIDETQIIELMKFR